MMNKRDPRHRNIRPWLVVIVLMQALFLLALAGSYHAAHALGEEIRLKTAPVDPRDLFYGDYVTLRYEISSIPVQRIADLKPDSDGDIEDLYKRQIYVVLTEEEGIHRLKQAYLERSNIPKGSGPVLRGIIQGGWNDEVNVKYGLERYYVPEGKGTELELRQEEIIMRVKIAAWGQALIVGPDHL